MFRRIATFLWPFGAKPYFVVLWTLRDMDPAGAAPCLPRPTYAPLPTPTAPRRLSPHSAAGLVQVGLRSGFCSKNSSNNEDNNNNNDNDDAYIENTITVITKITRVLVIMTR